MITTSTIWTRSSGRRKLAPKSQPPAAQSSHVRDASVYQAGQRLQQAASTCPLTLATRKTAAVACDSCFLLLSPCFAQRGIPSWARTRLAFRKGFSRWLCVFCLVVVVVLIEKSYILTKLNCLTRVCFLRHSQLTYCGRFVFDGVPGLISVTVQHRVHNRIHFVIADTATAFLVEREGSGCQSATFLECLSHASFFSFFLFL